MPRPVPWGIRPPRARSSLPRIVRSAIFPSLDLRDECAGCEDEASDGRVLEALGHELHADLSPLELVEQDPDVVLAPRQSIDGVCDDDDGLAAAQRGAQLAEPMALEQRPAPGVADAPHDPPTSPGCELQAGALLRVERGPVASCASVETRE